MRNKILLLAALPAFIAGSAQAVTVNFDGTMDNVCTITADNDGALGVASDAKTLSSALTGGAQAQISVIATATNDLTFGAPALTNQPAAYSGTPTLEISYSGAGVSQGFTGSEGVHAVDYPGGAITLDARAVDSTGFPAGDYRITTVVTCAPQA